MREKIILLSLILLVACSSAKQSDVVSNENPASMPGKNEKEIKQKEFARGELILATDLLVKIFDKEMAPLSCVPEHDEAELLLRTIRPRMEVVEDDITAMLDDKDEVKKLIDTCSESCICEYVSDLIREHMVPISKMEAKNLAKKNTKQETSRCLNYAQTTFCSSELYKALNVEKKDFSFDEGSL